MECTLEKVEFRSYFLKYQVADGIYKITNFLFKIFVRSKVIHFPNQYSTVIWRIFLISQHILKNLFFKLNLQKLKQERNRFCWLFFLWKSINYIKFYYDVCRCTVVKYSAVDFKRCKHVIFKHQQYTIY